MKEKQEGGGHTILCCSYLPYRPSKARSACTGAATSMEANRCLQLLPKWIYMYNDFFVQAHYQHSNVPFFSLERHGHN